jgi:hypothetical protein
LSFISTSVICSPICFIWNETARVIKPLHHMHVANKKEIWLLTQTPQMLYQLNLKQSNKI